MSVSISLSHTLFPSSRLILIIPVKPQTDRITVLTQEPSSQRQNLNIHLALTKESYPAGQILFPHLTILTVKIVLYYLFFFYFSNRMLMGSLKRDFLHWAVSFMGLESQQFHYTEKKKKSNMLHKRMHIVTRPW